jgi:hypothetical protein
MPFPPPTDPELPPAESAEKPTWVHLKKERALGILGCHPQCSYTFFGKATCTSNCQGSHFGDRSYL